jgi:hypothetical protein
VTGAVPPSAATSIADPGATLTRIGERAEAFRRLARVLVGYGIVGLIVAALALVALFIGVARVNGIADRFGGDVGGISRTLDRTSDVLEKAASTARGFGATIDGTTGALTVVAGDIDSIVPRLDSIADQTAALNILGSQPLAGASDLFREISTQLRDVRGQLATVSTSLTTNRGALETNAGSLADLAAETRQLSLRLDGATLAGAIEDLRVLLVIVLGIGALGAAVPAVGALLVGLWLRREVGALAGVPGRVG